MRVASVLLLALLGVAVIILIAGGWFLLRDEHLPPIATDVPYASVDGNLVFSARVIQPMARGKSVLASA